MPGSVRSPSVLQSPSPQAWASPKEMVMKEEVRKRPVPQTGAAAKQQREKLPPSQAAERPDWETLQGLVGAASPASDHPRKGQQQTAKRPAGAGRAFRRRHIGALQAACRAPHLRIPVGGLAILANPQARRLAMLLPPRRPCCRRRRNRATRCRLPMPLPVSTTAAILGEPPLAAATGPHLGLRGHVP